MAIDIDARFAEATRLAEDGDSQRAGRAALDVLRARPDHDGAIALLEEIADGIDSRALDSFIKRLPATAEFSELAARLKDLMPKPLPTFDEPVVYDDSEFAALRERLVALRGAGSLGEAAFRYRAAFAGYPSLTDSKFAVEQDPIPAPDGYAYPPRPAA